MIDDINLQITNEIKPLFPYRVYRPQTYIQRLNNPQPHWHRVDNALNRLSRDKWISGDEAVRIAFKLASHCSANSHATVNRVICQSKRAIGILRGHAPAYLTLEYDKFQRIRRALNSSNIKSRPPELVILEAITKGN